jgi:hypothetical protein
MSCCIILMDVYCRLEEGVDVTIDWIHDSVLARVTDTFIRVHHATGIIERKLTKPWSERAVSVAQTR